MLNFNYVLQVMAYTKSKKKTVQSTVETLKIVITMQKYTLEAASEVNEGIKDKFLLFQI